MNAAARVRRFYYGQYSRLPFAPANSLVIRPYAGLSNRLLALASAMGLAEDLNMRGGVRMVWVQDYGLNAPFDALFEITDARLAPAPKALTRLAKLRNAINKNYRPRGWDLYKHNFWTTLSLALYPDRHVRSYSDKSAKTWFASARAYIASNYRFYETRFHNLSFLRPIPSIQAKIDACKKRLDFENLVGAHVRRGDHISQHLNPDEKFFTRMQRAVDENPAVQFYLASDDQVIKDKLKAKFGERVVARDAHLARDDAEGMQEAVVDLYLLAEAKSVIGSAGSSFSDLARAIGEDKRAES